MKPGILVWDDNAQLHKKNFFGGGEPPQGVPSNSAKTHFVFFLSPIQPISTMFETTGVNVSAGAYTRDKFLNFRVGYASPKNCPRKQYFGWVLVTSVQLKQHNFG